MADKLSPTIIGNRYELKEVLGRGGMGVVYRAGDILTGNSVALKQVTIPTTQLAFASRSGSSDLAYALAQEFRTLASVRHPHIIRVYDFAFDRQRQPYFTMEHIDGGRNILDAGRGQPFESRVNLIIQMLQALVYLHRRGILHRDMKPPNALVLAGNVKLLDFGLSVITSHTMEHLTQTTAGTMEYMAPELFNNEPYSQASDLYAAGLIAFELITGEFPYSQNNMAVMINEILSKQVDASSYGLGAALAEVFNRLLVKTREDRYDDAAEVIADLCAATDLPVPPETEQIRESFLKAARFVGRKTEMARLTGLLEAAVEGHGHVVLVGGESGVGKSRLMEEMRTRALVEGVLVLRGQAVSNGRNPYQLWHDVLRTAILYANLDADEVSLIRAVVPNVDALLTRRTGGVPKNGRTAALPQLSQAVARILGGVAQPVVIILEDLQWAGPESIRLLGDLIPAVTGRPILLAATYRDDGSFTFPDELAPAERLHLGRFSSEDITDLSESMLGDIGRDPKVITLLEKETEGNAFFLVEAVRTLAEEAGRLDRISVSELPDSIVASGIRAILAAHLNRVPEEARPMLQLASVAGRVLDLSLLQVLEPHFDFDKWLAICTDVAVLEPYGETWRFSHDKLREEIKEGMSHDLHVTLHRRVAEALEITYPDAPEHAAMLAYHWAVDGNREKELYYTEIAGHQAAGNNANEEAIIFFERALTLLLAQPETEKRDRRELALQMSLGPILMAVRGFNSPKVIRAYDRARELATRTNQVDILFQALWGQWEYYSHGKLEDIAIAEVLLGQLFELAEQSNDENLLLEAHHSGWTTSWITGDAARMNEHTRQGLAIYNPTLSQEHIRIYGHDPGVCAHGAGAISLWLLGFPDKARELIREGELLAKEIDHPYSTAINKWGIIMIPFLRGDNQEALARSYEMISLAQEHGFTDFLGLGELFKKTAYAYTLEGSEQLTQMRMVYRQALDGELKPWLISLFLQSCLAAGAVDEGLQTGKEELANYADSGYRLLFLSELRRLYGELLLAKDEKELHETEYQFQLSLEITREQRVKSLELRTVMSLARLWQKQGNRPQAHQLLAEIYGWFTEGFETADLIAARRLLQALSERPHKNTPE